MMSAFFDLVAELQFQPADNSSAFGDINGCATKVTILNDEPLSLMFAFYVGGTNLELPPDTGPLPDAEKIDLSLEDGFVWLTLFNLVDPNGVEISQLIRQFVGILNAAGFAVSSQCGICGDQDVDIQLIDGRAVRVCARCLEAKQRETEELNRANPGQAILVPLGVLGTALAWGATWLLLDFYVEWLNAGRDEQVFEVNMLTLIPIGVCGFLLFLLGGKLGDWLWKSGASRRAPMLVSAIVVSILVLLGELFYITIALWRQVGVPNIVMASQLFLFWIWGYSVDWMIFKIGIAACLFAGCLSGHEKTTSTSLT